MDEEENSGLFLTDNVLKKGRLLNIAWQNWVDGIIMSILVASLVNMIPFIPKVRIVVIAMTVAVVFSFNLKGIKNRSLFQIIVAEIRFRHRRRRLHLRTPEYKRNMKQEENKNESLAEILIERIKEKRNKFVETYRTK